MPLVAAAPLVPHGAADALTVRLREEPEPILLSEVWHVLSSEPTPAVKESNTGARPRFNLWQRWKHCTFTKWLVALLLVFALIVSFWPAIGGKFVLLLYGKEFPHAPYTLITYAFVHAGLLHWLINSLWIVLLGLVIEPRISAATIVALTLVGALAGGVTMWFFNPVESSSAFAGSSPIIHGYAGAATVLLLLHLGDFARTELAIVTLMDVLTLNPWVSYWAPTITTWLFGAMVILVYTRLAEGPKVIGAV